MNDLEDHVRGALERHVGSIHARPMPPGVPSSVRRRRGALAVRGAAGVAALVAAVAVVVTTIPRGDRPTTIATGSPHPLEAVPPDWPVLDVDPRLAHVPDLSGDGRVVAGPVALVSGTVEGRAFTLYGYSARDAGDVVACLGFIGFAPGADMLARAPDVGACASDASPAGGADGTGWMVPDEVDLAVLGGGSSADVRIEANFGFVSDRVARLAVFGGDGSVIDIPILDGIDGWSVRPYFFVPPIDAAGVTAYGADGTPLATSNVCRPSDVPASCRVGVGQLVPVPGADASPSDAWPTASTGGDFDPYVDHVVDLDGVTDPGVVGEKTVVAYGTVNDQPWSLAAFLARGGHWGGGDGPTGSDEPVPVGELFVGRHGSMGGTGVTLAAGSRVLDVTGVAFGGAGVTAFVGVVPVEVDRLELRLDTGAPRDVALVDGPEGIDARYFVIWTPPGVGGIFVALDAHGEELDRAEGCAAVLQPDATSSCG